MNSMESATWWTDARQAMLAECAALGWTARQIGDRLGKSRSSVIGRAHRTHVVLKSGKGPSRMRAVVHKPQFWTETRSREARDMWLSGMPIARIASLIGNTVHAVQNKARSAKWGRHPIVLAREAAVAARREGRRPEPMVVKVVECGETDGFAFDDVPDGGCRYALNSAPRHDVGRLRFCGDQKREGSSYCIHHHAVVWQPEQRRAHRRAA